MGRVEIRPVDLSKEAVAWVKTWWDIYDGDPLWIPPLIADRKKFLDPGQNPYFKRADIQAFWALKDGKPVATISAQIDHAFQKENPGVGFFGFFEFPNDPDIAGCLIEAAKDWLRERGMKEVWGPFNFNTNHEFGLKTDGFDTPPAMLNPTNASYYPEVFEAIGLEPVHTYFAYWFERKPTNERMVKLSDRVLKRNPEISIRSADMKNWDDELMLFKEIYEDAWEENWGHTKISDEEFMFAAADLKQVIDPELVLFVYVGDEVAGAAITFMDLNPIAKKMNGRIFPFGWWHFLTGRKKLDTARVWVLGIKHKFQKMPLGAPLYVKTWETLYAKGVKGADASLVLEENFRMRGALEKLGAEIYQTYKIFGCKLVEEAEVEDEDLEATSVIPERQR